jgi:hypothetical protein
MSANRLTRPKQTTKYHGRSWVLLLLLLLLLLAGGVSDSAKDAALDAKVVADAVGHRQIASGELGGVGLEGEQ